MATKKYVRRSIQEKKRILEGYDQLPPMSLNAAAGLLNVTGPLLGLWLRKRGIKTARWQLPRATYKTPKVEAALWMWIDRSRANGVAVNESMIRKKASEVATEMGLCRFWPGTKWLARFKARESIIREMFQVLPADEDAGEEEARAGKTHHRFEAAMWRWMDQARQNGVKPSESAIRSKAYRLAAAVGHRGFRATGEWLRHFRAREGVIRAKFRIGAPNHSVPRKRKNSTSTKTQQLECALWQWIDRSRENGLVVNESMIRSEASRLAKTIGFNFRASKDWFVRFRARERTLALGQVEPDEHQSESASDRLQQTAMNRALDDLDVPKLEPIVVSADLDGESHSVTVPSLWQMKEAMNTLATGLLYRGFCEFNLLHQFEQEVDNVVRRSLTLRAQNSFQA